VANFNVNESAGTATITVTRTGGSLGAVSVAYTTSNGTATAGTNYSAKSGTLNWNAGEVSNKTFAITLANTHMTSSKTVNLILSSPSGGAVLGANNPAALTIQVARPRCSSAWQFRRQRERQPGDGDHYGDARRWLQQRGGCQLRHQRRHGDEVDQLFPDRRHACVCRRRDEQDFTVNVLKHAQRFGFEQTVNLTLTAPTGGARWARLIRDADDSRQRHTRQSPVQQRDLQRR